MTAEEKLKELEEKDITCADCGKFDTCSLPKESICFSYENRPNS